MGWVYVYTIEKEKKLGATFVFRNAEEPRMLRLSGEELSSPGNRKCVIGQRIYFTNLKLWFLIIETKIKRTIFIK